MKAALLAALLTLLAAAAAQSNGYYHQEYNYKTSSSSYKNNELQRSNDDQGHYSRDGDLEGRFRPKVNTHSQHAEYVNPRTRDEYGIGQTHSYGQLNAQDRLTSAGSIFDHNAGNYQSGGYGVNSNLRTVTQSLQEELARELQQAVYSAHRRSSAYSNVVSQSQVQADLQELEEALRRNVTMRLQQALRSQYGNQGVRGALSYSIQDGHLQPTANYHNQELTDLTRQVEDNLLRQLENQFQTQYHTQVHTTSSSSSAYQPNYPAPIQQRPVPLPVYHPQPQPQPTLYPVLPTYPAVRVSNTDSITTIATRVQTDLNEHLNRILDDTQRRYFTQGSGFTGHNYETILHQLQQELRNNITLQFDNQINRSYGYGADRSYNVQDLENLKRQMETNLITKLNRDFNKQRERYFETYSTGSTHQYYQTNHHQPTVTYYPSSNYQQQGSQYQDLSHIQRQLQEDLSRQIQAALTQHQFTQQQSRAYSTSNYNPQSTYQASLQQLTAELNRNLTRQLEESLQEYYRGQDYQTSVYNSQMENLKGQLQNNLLRQLQQGLQQSYSRYSSWSSSSSSSSNYRPVRGFDQSLYSGNLVAGTGEDCMYGDDPNHHHRNKRDSEDDDDLTQQVEQEPLYTTKVNVGPIQPHGNVVRHRVHYYEQLNHGTNQQKVEDVAPGSGGYRTVHVTRYNPQQVEWSDNNSQGADLSSGGYRRRVTTVTHSSSGSQNEDFNKLVAEAQQRLDDLRKQHLTSDQYDNGSNGGYTRRVTVTRYLTRQQNEDAEKLIEKARQEVDSLRNSESSVTHYRTNPQQVEDDVDSNTNQQVEDLTGDGGHRRVTVTRYRTSPQRVEDVNTNNNQQVEDLTRNGGYRKVTVTRYRTSPQRVEDIDTNTNQQVEDVNTNTNQQAEDLTGDGGYRRVTVTRHRTSPPRVVDVNINSNQQVEDVNTNTNQQAEDLTGDGGYRRVTVTRYRTSPQQVDVNHDQGVDDLSSGGYRRRVTTVTHHSTSGQSEDYDNLLAAAQQKLDALRHQHLTSDQYDDGTSGGYTRRVTVTRYLTRQQNEDAEKLIEKAKQEVESLRNSGSAVTRHSTTPQQVDNQRAEDLTGAGGYRTVSVTRYRTSHPQQVPSTSTVNGQVPVGSYSTNEDLAQHVEDQHIRNLTQLTQQKQVEQSGYSRKPAREVAFDLESPGQQVVDDDLTQQQTQDFGYGKLETGSLTNRPEKPSGQQEIDDDSDLTQQTQQVEDAGKLQAVSLSNQPVVHDDDLTQQTQDFGYGKLETGSLTNQPQKPLVDDDDLTQQVEDSGFGKLQAGGLTSQPKIPEDDDLTQQQTQDFGYGKLETGSLTNQPQKPLNQQDIDYDSDLTQQVEDSGYNKLQTGSLTNQPHKPISQHQVYDDLDLSQQQSHNFGLTSQPRKPLGQQGSGEDLTQQTEDLTQQTEDLNQQVEDSGYNKLQTGSLTNQPHKPISQHQVDDDIDLNQQQTQNFGLTSQPRKPFGQQQSSDEDLTQQTEDLTQQIEDSGYNKLQTGSLTNQSQKPISQHQIIDDIDLSGDLTQQQTQDFGLTSQPLDQQQVSDEDLTQQTQDLTQQVEDSGFGKLDVRYEQSQPQKPTAQHQLDDDFDVGYSKLTVGQHRQDLDQQTVESSTTAQQLQDNSGGIDTQNQQLLDILRQTSGSSSGSYSYGGSSHSRSHHSSYSYGQQTQDGSSYHQSQYSPKPVYQYVNGQRTHPDQQSGYSQHTLEVKPIEYHPRPVYQNTLGQEIQVGTTRQEFENSELKPIVQPVHQQQSGSSYGSHSYHYGTPRQVDEENIETAQELEQVEQQRAHVVEQVAPSGVKNSGVLSVEVPPPEPEVEDVTTTPKPGFWSRVGNKIKDKASKIKEQIG